MSAWSLRQVVESAVKACALVAGTYNAITMDLQTKLTELQRLEAETEKVRGEIYAATHPTAWAPKEYYTMFHILAGMILGIIGAGSSLLFNVIGSLVFGQHPLQLIRVYLTFPLGEAALTLDSGFALASGCCLYLATGAVYGIVFHLVMSRFFAESSAVKRFEVGTAMGVALWLINYYGVLSWLQPALFGGNWIVQLVPWWVAAITHLVFAWTLLLIDRWGHFEAYTPR